MQHSKFLDPLFPYQCPSFTMTNLIGLWVQLLLYKSASYRIKISVRLSAILTLIYLRGSFGTVMKASWFSDCDLCSELNLSLSFSLYSRSSALKYIHPSAQSLVIMNATSSQGQQPFRFLRQVLQLALPHNQPQVTAWLTVMPLPARDYNYPIPRWQGDQHYAKP